MIFFKMKRVRVSGITGALWLVAVVQGLPRISNQDATLAERYKSTFGHRISSWFHCAKRLEELER